MDRARVYAEAAIYRAQANYDHIFVDAKFARLHDPLSHKDIVIVYSEQDMRLWNQGKLPLVIVPPWPPEALKP